MHHDAIMMQSQCNHDAMQFLSFLNFKTGRFGQDMHSASLVRQFRLGCVAGKALDYLVQQRKNVAISSFALTSRDFAVPWPSKKSKQFC